MPTENAFSEHLSQFLFQVFEILVVDQMHEFELGVWKALIIHLVCILNALGQSQVQEFNSRYVIMLFAQTVTYLFIGFDRSHPLVGIQFAVLHIMYLR